MRSMHIHIDESVVSMHIHNKRISQLHTISGNQCSARIKQLALSETYNTSPFLHFVSEIALCRTTLHKCISSNPTTIDSTFPQYCRLDNLIAWLVQYIIVSATHPISHHGISNSYQHLLFNDRMLIRETRCVSVFPQFVILTVQTYTSTLLSLCFNVLYPHDFYGLLPEHIKQTAAYSVFF